MEGKLRCVNFRRVIDHRKAFRPVVGITVISDNWYRSTTEVIVTSWTTPRSTGENVGCTREHMEVPAQSLVSLVTTIGELTTSLDTLGSTSNHCKADCENDIFFRNIAHAPGNHYSQIFSGWVEVKATLPTGTLELLPLELHPPSRSWQSVNPPAGSSKFLL